MVRFDKTRSVYDSHDDSHNKERSFRHDMKSKGCGMETRGNAGPRPRQFGCNDNNNTLLMQSEVKNQPQRT